MARLFFVGTVWKEAIASGLANPHWFRPKVDPKEIRELSIKQDLRPTIDALIWLDTCNLWQPRRVYFSILVGFAMFWLIYGVLYSSASDARWHECGHSTAFRTPWKNERFTKSRPFFAAVTVRVESEPRQTSH